MKQLLLFILTLVPLTSYAETLVTILLSSSDQIAVSETSKGLYNGLSKYYDRLQIIVDSPLSAFNDDSEFTLNNPLIEFNYFDQPYSDFRTVSNGSSCLEKVDKLILHGKKNNKRNRLYLALSFNKADLTKHEDGIRDVVQPSLVRFNQNSNRLVRCTLANTKQTALSAAEVARWPESVNE